jgi:hydroxysqualene synthase
MTVTDRASTFESGKGHRDENFPVASFLIRRRHRAVILAFYGFARAADDIADHPSATPAQKLAALARMRAALLGETDAEPSACRLRVALAERGLRNRHALDILEAFTRDVTKTRYRDWADLIDYCSYSAAPVGRFVLDVHGEQEATWPASDALCAALQVINHLQDCGADFRRLDRVYMPLDEFAASSIDVGALAESHARPELRAAIERLAAKCAGLLQEAQPLAERVRDRRLALEIAVIQKLAESLTQRLMHRDPLSERVHHRSFEAAGLGVLAALRLGTSRFSLRLTRGSIRE